MFSELIYTRCRQGIDIIKSGSPITGDGFKVYSCSRSLIGNGNTDLQFLLNAAQGKQSYNDPAFMDDAYLYLVPDKGDSFMVDFHPIPYDEKAKGDYSHRPGNFINQVLVGDYSGFYPFELFGKTDVWNAKAQGEAYYYENAPAALPDRGDIGASAGKITIDDLAAFISDGRKEALKAAVSFIISQYELPPEDRKFLVIRDESSRNIELWIAAIEHAFSPRIAASVPFATRLDNFTAANRYTVNQLGAYQTQINLQDPNQKQRYRAMIVGVDERDKTNASARPLANSPFVLLDGIEKRAAFDADIKNRYYDLITGFDDNHIMFCRKFLQMLDIKKPCADIYRLFEIYGKLENSSSLPDAKALAETLSFLGNYNVYDCPKLRSLYGRVKKEFLSFLQGNPDDALQITKWLKSVSEAVGDDDVIRQLTDAVNKFFVELVFKKIDGEGVLPFWESLKDSEFAAGVAGNFTAVSTLQNYKASSQRFTPSGKITFVRVYLECAALSGTAGAQNLKNVVAHGLGICAQGDDTDSGLKIMDALSRNGQVNARDMLFSIAKEAKEAVADFIAKLLIEEDNSAVASDASMMTFIKKLGTDGAEHLVVPVLKCRINTFSKPADILRFIKLIGKIQALSDNDLIRTFEALDRKFTVTDAEKGWLDAASVIQREKPEEAVCVNSAHLCAIEALNDGRKRRQFADIYDRLKTQKFPTETNAEYIKNLTVKLVKAKMDQTELEYVIRLFSGVPAYMAGLVGVIFDMAVPGRNNDLNNLMAVAAKTRARALDDAITGEFIKKALSQFNGMLTSEAAQRYLADIVRIR
jgi:hypothetical protein